MMGLTPARARPGLAAFTPDVREARATGVRSGHSAVTAVEPRPASRAAAPTVPRRFVNLMYHDVISKDPDVSGFTGAGPGRYKVSWPRFMDHLRVLEDALGGVRPSRVTDAGGGRRTVWTLTFDDGGCSALEVGRVLAACGWHGHFLVTVDRIGDPGFLDVAGIRELATMGHVVGSHSCSHPTRMSKCSTGQLLDEWGRSVAVLSDILDCEVRVASVPGGAYSRRVALAAENRGIRYLFTSEPRVTTFTVGGCLVLGRFAVHRRTSSACVAAMARMKAFPRAWEYAEWTALKLAKAAGGDTYLRARTSILSKSEARRTNDPDDRADASRIEQ